MHGVDAGRGGVEIPADASDPGRLDHVRVYENVVTAERRMVRADVTDAAHVRGELIDVVHALHGAGAVLEETEVGDEELVGGRGLELGLLDVNATHPIPSGFKRPHEVVTDEAAGSRDDDPLTALPPVFRFPVQFVYKYSWHQASKATKLQIDSPSGCTLPECSVVMNFFPE